MKSGSVRSGGTFDSPVQHPHEETAKAATPITARERAFIKFIKCRIERQFEATTQSEERLHSGQRNLNRVS